MSKIAKINNERSIDLSRLIESRLLIQANSGGGKSWAIRRLIEQSFGKVQIIVLDPEGEFTNLRQKYDFVFVGKGGDAPAESRSAALLATRLLELKASAVVDLYELPPHERKKFVRLFCEAIVNAPKELWSDCLVIIDEAHIFAPEKGESEAMGPVIDLATRGRKRGYCVVLATQRLSKLNKDAAAECNNKMIGRAAQDIDMKRSADELGFTTKEQLLGLRLLKPGEFYMFGPAISDEVVKVKVGEVHVPPPPRGVSKTVPPPPTEKVRKLIARLADLPQEAKKEATTVAELKQQVGDLRRQLRERPTEKVVQEKVKIVEVPTITDKQLVRLEKALLPVHKALVETLKPVNINVPAQIPLPQKVGSGGKGQDLGRWPSDSFRINREEPVAVASGEIKVMGGALRMLKVLVSRYPMRLTKSQLATFAKMAPKGGSFGTYLSTLRSNNLVTAEGELLVASQEGIDFLGDTPNPPQTSEEVIDMWRKNLTGGARRMFDVLVRHRTSSVSKEELGQLAGVSPSGGSFGTYLSMLRSNGLVETTNDSVRLTIYLYNSTHYD